MISLKNITLQRGKKVLFNQASAIIFAKQKVGLIGRNGSGKTSLFSLLLQKIPLDGGEVYVQANIKIRYLAQEVPEAKISALQYVMNGDREVSELIRRLKQAEENHDGHLITALHNRLYEIDGYNLESRAAKLLIGLGFGLQEQEKAVNAFSGGWRMRLNLAQVLMGRADLLLLDEPTNYLDLDAMVWLERWLQNFQGTLLLISHDRDFLDNVVEKIIYISNGKLETYSGNYSSFERQRSEKLIQEQKLYQKQQAKIEHLNKYINRFRAKASKARQAQSRLKMLEKMEKVEITQADSPFSFKFYQPQSCNAPLLYLRNVNVSYGNHLVLSKINFSLGPDDAIGILGINGAGKSTFIKTIAGILPVSNGEVFFNKNLKVGYFAQHQIDQLDMQTSPINHVLKLDPAVSEQKIRNFLGGFGFHGEMVFQPITNFSGGEKARLVLALIIWQKPNLLLLDEPTNHLDLEMRTALNYALQDYTGALVLVAHDRYLLQATVNDFYLIDDYEIKKFTGDLKDYQKWLLNLRKKQLTVFNKQKEDVKDQLVTENKKKGLRSHAKEIQQIEKEIAKLHQEKESIARILSDPQLYLQKNKQELEEHLKRSAMIEERLKILEDRWMTIL